MEKPLHKCCKCGKLAIWMYAPSGETKEEDRYYCDDCVSRGCSCNVDPVTLEEDRDEEGRLYPCCEYWWDDKGFEKEP